jgi:hypothetical protein
MAKLPVSDAALLPGVRGRDYEPGRGGSGQQTPGRAPACLRRRHLDAFTEQVKASA